MSLARLGVLVALVAVAMPSTSAFAQGEDRFFFDNSEGESKKERKKTSFDGSITSTSFVHKEIGALVSGIENSMESSRTEGNQRLFTDLRLQLNARHIGGSTWHFRGDVRGRYAETCTVDGGAIAGIKCAETQSGTFGGEELDVREFYLRRDGKNTDATFGRQYVMEVAATKFDGLKIENQKDREWTYIVFGGLFPTRGSRDIRRDYPKALPDPATLVEGGPVTPLVGGVAAAYRLDKLFGSIGAAGVFPLAKDKGADPVDNNDDQIEKPRIFVTANGYWRPDPQFDLYHYAVIDVAGAAGAQLTNLTAGVNYRPVPAMRVYLQGNHLDTETLNISAQQELDNPDGGAVAEVHNNVIVSRVAQDSARAGVSGAFAQNRFEVSTTAGYRRRPEIRVEQINGNLMDPTDDVRFLKAEAIDISFRVLDRRSWKDLRISGTFIRSFGFRGESATRSKVNILRLDVAKDVKEGRGEVEGFISYVGSSDESRETACLTTPQQCFGSSNATTISIGGTVFYRVNKDWFLLGMASLAQQTITVYDQQAAEDVKLPVLTMAQLLVRLAYRF